MSRIQSNGSKQLSSHERKQKKLSQRLRNAEVSMVENMASMSEAVSNLSTMRVEWLKRLQEQNERDIDEACGYPKVIEPLDYRNMFDRGLGKRVVTFEPCESWVRAPEIYDSEESDETPWEEAWKNLNKQFKLLQYMFKVDILCGIGRYGLLLFGIRDGRPLSEPVSMLPKQGYFDPDFRGKPTDLLFVRTLDESLCNIVEWEDDEQSPRYGQPLMYELTLVDPEDLVSSTKMKNLDTAKVHWSRVVHVADNRLSSEVFGAPRQEDVWNEETNIKKIMGANGEGFWQSAFAGLAFESQPIEGGTIFDDDDIKKLKEQARKYMNSMERMLMLVGMTVKSMAPQVIDPSPHLKANCQKIAMTKGWPYRVFMGSEEAQLASGQDIEAHRDRMGKRREDFIEPDILRATVDRLLAYGCLPPPQDEEYFVHWPDMSEPGQDEIATIAGKFTVAFKDYVQGGCNDLIVPEDYLTQVCKFPPEVVKTILDNALGQMEAQDSGETVILGGPTEEEIRAEEQQKFQQQDTQRQIKDLKKMGVKKVPKGLAKNKLKQWLLNKWIENYNPYHEPGGSKKGGQFTSGPKAGGKPMNPEGKTTIEQFSNGTKWDNAKKWTEERRKLHDRIIAELSKGVTRVDNPVSYMTGGGPASGKSTLVGNLGLPSNMMKVDADVIKAMLPEYKQMVDAGDKGAGAFVHAESSYLAKLANEHAVKNGFNLFYDTTGDSNIESLTETSKNLRGRGRKVVAVYATVEVDVAVKRAEERGKITGRFVPESAIRGIHAAVSDTFPKAIKAGIFDQVDLYDTTTHNVVHIASAKKSKLKVHHREHWNNFKRKAKAA